MTMNRLRAQDQDGYALATAIIVMSIMLTIGLGALAFVDSETSSSNRERIHESRLNLTEGVVAAEVFQMSRNWPATAAKQYPDTCTETTVGTQCPTPAQLQAQFSGQDFKPGGTRWTVQVRDDVAGPTGQFYSDASVGKETWDKNGNGEMWLRAEGQLGTKKRTVVARIRVENRLLKLPAAAFVSGAFKTTNNGKKVIVDTKDPASGGVVRCDTGGDTGHKNDCLDYEDGQIAPAGATSDPSAGPALSASYLATLKEMATTNGTYYPGCPPSGDPSGAVVWVVSGNCSYGGNLTVNPTTKQGIFILENGTLDLKGTVDWFGVIYALNAQGARPQDASVVTLNGNANVHGAILIDGGGLLELGSSGLNLQYDAANPPALMVTGTAGIVQNSWRELIAG